RGAARHSAACGPGGAPAPGSWPAPRAPGSGAWTASTHLLYGFDPHDLEAGRNDRRGSLKQGEARGRQRGVGCHPESHVGVILAFVPQAMKGGDVIKVEGDAVRFMRFGSGFHESGPSGKQFREGELGWIGQAIEARPARERPGCGQTIERAHDLVPEMTKD